MFEVKLRSGHPTGTYRRGGKVFQRGVTVKMASVPKTIAEDKWLVVSETDEKEKKPPRPTSMPAAVVQPKEGGADK